MSDSYRVLHYPGNVSSIEGGVHAPAVDDRSARTVPALLGADLTGHPYEVLDAEYSEARDRTTVNLQPATVETMRGWADASAAQGVTPEEVAHRDRFLELWTAGRTVAA